MSVLPEFVLPTWLPVHLRSDVETLVGLIPLHLSQDTPADERKRRPGVLVHAATLPGLRLCEARRLLLLAQSAPAVDLALLFEALDRLATDFDTFYPSLGEDFERVVTRLRKRLGILHDYARRLAGTSVRRTEAEKFAAVLENSTSSPSLGTSRPRPYLIYVGYEVDALLPALKEIKYPSALELPYKRHKKLHSDEEL